MARPYKERMIYLVQEQICALRESVPYNIPICKRTVNKNIKAKNLFGSSTISFTFGAALFFAAVLLTLGGGCLLT